MLHTLLDSSCTSQPALDEYAQEHGQAFLDGDLLADIVNGSLDLPRTTLADGIPNGVVDLGLEAAGVSGWQATLLRGVLLPVVRPYLGDGIDNIAIEGLECGDFSLRRVESEYCLPFRIGGWVHGLGVVCRGTYVLSLSWSAEAVPPLVPAPTSELRGGFRLALDADRSSLHLLKLDLQRSSPFTAFSRRAFFSLKAHSSFAFNALSSRLESARAFLQGAVSCATGHQH
ncbi:hypothetical protein EMIHUDRAFT_451183 [Emiliania huxleyi CCMP1516]|uniref:SMP-LTD domain-containing protein n=2 Tax=Emiliania huxleyi TaxID=2903 RepID=A0A0D3J7X6_EMIH1|nr:hypothetical protein EMIHUDRAFT_451183 [Emiliania huxleyi CCMP1516]EOD19611.1 hypothetical protein EMIHUDRAFT_451183 [Emiliania huxleyi CCMP1516]|eukprot:XP_005772040.1 hypothetical protein EMIHUDRAFT_451183 [Emiliania huxleyi CCMP1516]